MPRRKLEKPKVPGLDRPIEIPFLKIPDDVNENPLDALDWADEQSKKQDEFIASERARKFDALIKYYDLPHDTLSNHTTNYASLLVLCQRMAYDFIDGFMLVYESKQRRPTVWNEGVHYVLWYEVEQKIKSGKKSLSNICRHLARQTPWSSLINKKVKDKGTALYDQYTLANGSTIVCNIKAKQQTLRSSKERDELATRKYESLIKIFFSSPEESHEELKRLHEEGKRFRVNKDS